MKRRRLAGVLPALMLGTLLLLPGTASACPNCKEALANSSETSTDDITSPAPTVTEGYSYSILMFLAVPATLLGGGLTAVVVAARRGLLPEL